MSLIRSLFKRYAFPLLILAVSASLGLVYWVAVIRMPGASYAEPLPPLSAEQDATRGRLRKRVQVLAEEIGERHLGRPEELSRAREWIVAQLSSFQLNAREHEFVSRDGRTANIEVLFSAREASDPSLVVGAHYDTARGTPGANDNGSGVALLLELAQRLRTSSPGRQALRLVFFTNEEPPYFHTEDMGSLRYVRRLKKEGVRVSAMLSLETLGFYSEEKGSQRYPSALDGLFPSQGNFVAFVGDSTSRDLVTQVVGIWREQVPFPSEGVAMSKTIQGIGWSDHWSFWQEGIPALMVTDTAPYRYAHYHKSGDTSDQVNFEHLARVADGLELVTRRLIEN